MASTNTSAIIYVNGGSELVRWLEQCVRYCESHGYGVAAIVMDHPGAGRWADVLALVAEGRAEVIVVARADHLPPDRPGRIEVIAEQQRSHPGQRRPHLRTSGDH